MGIAAVGMYKFGKCDRSLLLEVINWSVDTVATSLANLGDSLCCGVLGTIELHREAASVLGSSAVRTRATLQVAEVIIAAKRRGMFRWPAGNDSHNLSLFSGVAGVGYTLGRELAVAGLSNILLLE